MSWQLLAWATLLAVVAGYWHSSLAARELANRAATDTCANASVQMLDGTVSIRGLRLVRRGGGALAWRRIYGFDYTEDGFHRRRGFVVMTGRVVDSIGLGPRPA